MSEEGAAWHTAEGWERAARAFAAAWRAAARGPCGCGPAAEGTWCPACCGAAWRWVPPRPGALPAAAAKGHLLLEHLRLPPPTPQPGAGVQRGPAGDQPAAGLAGLAWEEPADEADEAAEEIQGASGALSCALYISYSEVFRVPALQLAAAGPGGSPVQAPALARSLGVAAVAGGGGGWEEVLRPAELPGSGLPGFALHACETPARLRLLEEAAAAAGPGSEARALWAWFSSVGGAVRAKVSAAQFAAAAGPRHLPSQS